MQRLFPGERVLLPIIYTLIYLYIYPIYINSLTNFEALSLHPLIIIVYLPCISYRGRGNLPISVAGIFMSAYDHSIWRFRTPV